MLFATLTAGGTPPAETISVPWSQYFQQSFYHAAIIPLLLITLILAYFARPSTSEVVPEGFRKFQWAYLTVWSFCVAADWLQGPYVYALYDAYGYSSNQIAELFVAGFASSLAFGCVVGSLCDRFGRKSCCMAYCVLYILSCMTKHFNNYGILMLGRITGGMATSMLFSCFECWMVSEHCSRHQFSNGLLSYMFGLMFTVMYGVAIVSGLVAQGVADSVKFGPIYEGSMMYAGGYCGPFDLSIGCLLVGLVLMMVLWEENHGADGAEALDSPVDNFKNACRLLVSNRPMMLLCAIVACFEGSMFAFVFNWTPALASKAYPTPHGVIFALFMMACMCGASVSTVTSDWMKPSTRLISAFLLGTGAFMTVALVVSNRSFLKTTFFAFAVFEFCCGLYFPSIGEVKSQIVPEHVRATVYNIYRVPLNGVVVSLLLTNLSIVKCFSLNAVLLSIALFAIMSIMMAWSREAEESKLGKVV
mmetsp:Transcript_30304/g.55144  ORF Transcript_30304/g.55144 Transcript_30304/m.55144 type:complete len:475 (-) Transcript_30304:79-1503(-)